MNTISAAITSATEQLKDAGIPSARLDAELLLAHTLNCSRLDLYLTWEKPLQDQEKKKFQHLLQRRLTHEPLPYILGIKEFWGLTLRVTPDVMIPRPETELLIELALEIIKQEQWHSPLIYDIGTGSGALALALAKEVEHAHIIATDISLPTLKVAHSNITRFDLHHEIKLVQTNLLRGLHTPADLIISNPPYIGKEYDQLEPELKSEPKSALYAGDDGLDVIKPLLTQAPTLLKPRGYLIVEISPLLKDTLPQLTKLGDFEPGQFFKDLAGKWRALRLKKKPHPA